MKEVYCKIEISVVKFGPIFLPKVGRLFGGDLGTFDTPKSGSILQRLFRFLQYFQMAAGGAHVPMMTQQPPAAPAAPSSIGVDSFGRIRTTFGRAKIEIREIRVENYTCKKVVIPS